MEKVVFVKSRLSRGAFPGECIFKVEQAIGEDLFGTAPLHYCFGADRRRLTAQIAPGDEVDGYVAGVELARNGQVKVHLPDGELYDVDEELVSGTTDRVPVQS